VLQNGADTRYKNLKAVGLSDFCLSAESTVVLLRRHSGFETWVPVFHFELQFLEALEA